ncbi:col27a1 protein [Spatholobus suberectus]|nr:col27a1 protein [Spatholobus suberectus]
MLGAEKEEQEKPSTKKTTTQSSTKNHTKLLKPTSPSSKNQTRTIKSANISSKNQTKTIKSNLISTKNQTKTTKLPNNSTKTIKSNNISSKNQTKPLKTTPTDTGLKKLNVTSKPNPVPISGKKSLDLAKASNKTTKATATKQTKTTKVDQTHETNKKQKTPPNQQQTKKKPTKQAPASWIMDEEEADDLVSEFTDLPNKFHRTLIPDLERISTTSKAYITKANNEMTKGFKPYVGKKYAPTVATIISCAFILIPLLLVSLLCTRIKAYFSLQKILIFIQVYLSIYFTILCVTSLFTGLEPLKFLYSTSQSTYLCLQVLQTLAYVFYLLLLLMYLVLVFSTECGLGSKFLGLAQIFVAFAVGLHYYVTVFHRVVLQQPPKTNWKIHGIYATCFLLICALARADRRKKTYVEDGGGEGKKN